MASTSQQRCVFVGNIPYDATEEQLKQICEEVGPVVSFRLVTDRETGKPKGYGFCEYKDEETALSARRNLLGYEINGRQLRVDFAENDKGSDSNRERGRGGPGMTANVDPQKQLAGPSILGDSAHQQPFGLSLATDAASKMAGALAGAQVSITANPNGLYGQAGLGGDPLTLHLAKMSRSQLNEIFSELKAMATEDKELARQLLLAHAQLPKALFQAQIMLGMVTPEMLQMPNIWQGGTFSQKLSQDGHQGRLPAFQPAPGLPPLAQNKMQFGMMPKVHEAQASATPQSSLGTNQVSAVPQHHTLSRVQMPNVAPIQVQQPSFPAQLPNLSARPQIHAATSSSLNQQMQVPLLQRSGRNETANPAHNRQLVNPNATFPTLLTQPPIPDPGFQMQLPPEVESALLQQVMNLTPEQLSLLPPDQQQQVMQLQQMLG